MVRNTKRNKKTYKKYKIMRGGFNGEEEGLLQAIGFSQEDIEFLQSLNMNMDLIQASLNTINLTTGINWTPQELINDLHNIINDNNSSISSIHSSLGNSYLSDISADLNESNESLNLSNISGQSEHNIDIDNNDFNELAQENLSQDSSLHLSDLERNPSALTDYPSDNSNDSNFSNVFNNSSFSLDSYNEEESMEGGKSNKSRKTRKSRNKSRTTRKTKKSKKTRKSRKTRR